MAYLCSDNFELYRRCSLQLL